MDWEERLEAQVGARKYLEETYGKNYRDKVAVLPLMNAYIDGWLKRGEKQSEVTAVVMSENDKKKYIDLLPTPRESQRIIEHTFLFGINIKTDVKVPDGVAILEDKDGKVVGLVNFK